MKFKNPFKSIARFFAIAYANRQYKKAITLADQLHSQTKDRYYVTISPFSTNGLKIMTRKEYRNLQNRYHHSVRYSVMRSSAVYYTADRAENNPMPYAEREKRRLAFVKFVLKQAKLS